MKYSSAGDGITEQGTTEDCDHENRPVTPTHEADDTEFKQGD